MIPKILRCVLYLVIVLVLVFYSAWQTAAGPKRAPAPVAKARPAASSQSAVVPLPAVLPAALPQPVVSVSGPAAVAGGVFDDAKAAAELADCQQILAKDPKNAEALFRQAVLFDAQRSKSARQLVGYYRRYLMNEPDVGSGRARYATFRLAEIADWIARRSRGQFLDRNKSAAMVFKEAPAGLPGQRFLIPASGNAKLFEQYMGQALKLQAMGRADEAQRQYLQALLCNPRTPEAIQKIDQFAKGKFRRLPTDPPVS